MIQQRGQFVTDPLGVYFDQLTPVSPTRHPTLLLIHGGGHTGSCWRITADGHPGWADRFAARGYPTLVPDWPGHGRSGAIAPELITGELLCQGLAGVIDKAEGPVVLVTHSMGGALGWRLAELRADRVVGIVALAPAPPGNIQPVGTVERATDDEVWVRTPGRLGRLRRRGLVLHDADFVTHKLVGDSARFPRAALPGYARMLTATAARLLFERQNTEATQLRVIDPTCLAGKHILLITGTEDLDHPRDIDEPIAAWAGAQGAHAEYVWLADHGIDGNGHMLMMEDNADTIADLVLDWLDHTFARR